MIVGYHPARLEALAQRSHDAVWALAVISCGDPAAESAMATVRHLQRTIEAGVLAAARDVLRSAPLTRSFGARSPGPTRRFRLGQFESSTTPPPSPYGPSDLHRALNDLARLLRLDDVAFLIELMEPFTSARDESRLLDIDSDEFALWAATMSAAIERRIERDPTFADVLADHAVNNPLIGLVVARSQLPPALTVTVLASTVTTSPGHHVDDVIRVEAIRELLHVVEQDPLMALDAIGRPDLIERLVRWHGVHTITDDITVDVATQLVGTAFSVVESYDLDAHGDLVALAFAELSALMNGEYGDRGLPSELALAYSAALVPLLPHVVGSFDGRGDFFLKRNDHSHIPIRLAPGHESVVDLFGGLMRDPASLRLMLAAQSLLGAAIPPDSSPLFTLDEFARFGAVLADASMNEQHEEAIVEQRVEAVFNSGFDLAARVLKTALNSPAQKLAIDSAARGAGWLFRTLISERDLDLTDVPALSRQLAHLGVITHVVTRLGHLRNPPSEVGQLIEQLDDITAQATGRGTDFDQVAASIATMGDTIDYLVGVDSPLDRDDAADLARVWAARDTFDIARSFDPDDVDVATDLAITRSQ